MLCISKFKLHKQTVFKLWAVEYAISFIFTISYLRLFQRGFFQQIYEKIIIFQYKFPRLISRCSTLQNIRMSNLVILKWRCFEYKAKFEKKGSFI